MICPSCGHPNDDAAFECTNCFYKFRLFHAYNDPAKGNARGHVRAFKNIKDLISLPGKKWIFIVGFILLGLMYIFPLYMQMLK